MKAPYFILALFLCGIAHAAKVGVHWENPTHNTDGSALTNLATITIEWGNCGAAPGSFGTRQSAITVIAAGAEQSAFIYPSGLKTVCVRAFATRSDSVSSDASDTVSKVLLPTLGKPITLEKAVILDP